MRGVLSVAIRLTWDFKGCYSLTSVTIPNGVTSIGRYAFIACSSLTRLTVPTTVTADMLINALNDTRPSNIDIALVSETQRYSAEALKRQLSAGLGNNVAVRIVSPTASPECSANSAMPLQQGFAEEEPVLSSGPSMY